MGNGNLSGKRVFIYARVSPSRQNGGSLSLRDQVAAAEAWVENSGAQVVRVFSEKASGTVDRCDGIHEMIASAESDDHPVDAILVETPSRLCRDAQEFRRYRNRLGQKNVEIVSLTHD
ncbi:recombinase family protein [Sphingomonas sp. HT-1]|uniref:recombinase family protein n=1 Tax=unclassified Sphingomonas TaxID=196159 RepID=UPI000315230A|nr:MULTISPECIES: recombinase family protein [unclassified Sphingomonas]KTF68978.1 hypothetical protein ATB93_10965 [Sphingomonas sp. WG]